MTKRPGPKISTALVEQVEAFLKMQPGDSFFVAHKKASDLQYLRRPVKLAGAGIQILEVVRDSVHKTRGVRVWRRAGSIDTDDL